MLELRPCINLPLPEDEIKEIVQKAIDWALMHGMCLRPQNMRLDEVQNAPFLLLPSTFPRGEFRKAVSMQTKLNELMHKVAYDYDFLHTCLSRTIKSDEFTNKLFKIYETVYADHENFKKAFNLGILRSDYMLDRNSEKIKQIEINAIASSFGGLSPVASNFHRFILSILGHSNDLNNLPTNDTTTLLSRGLVESWILYDNPESVILFVTEDRTVNIADQRYVEFQVQILNPNIKIIRKSMTALITNAKLNPDRELLVDNHIVSVVYYRSAYDPSFYPTENEWNVRLNIEKSKAIKCPSIQYQLAGTKKVQQMLSIPSNLKKFIKDEEDLKSVQDLFVNLYGLEFDDAGDKAVELARKNPEKFVLKPQREGGGHNVYDEDIRKMLELPKGSFDRTGYILMNRINPPSQKNYLIRARSDGENKTVDVVSELGIYGVIIGNQDKIIMNNQSGFLLRTKLQSSNEGGVAAGFGAIDSPYLVP